MPQTHVLERTPGWLARTWHVKNIYTPHTTYHIQTHNTKSNIWFRSISVSTFYLAFLLPQTFSLFFISKKWKRKKPRSPSNNVMKLTYIYIYIYMLVCKLSYLEAKYPCAHPSNAISVLPPALVCLFKSVLISTQFSFSHFFPWLFGRTWLGVLPGQGWVGDWK